AHHSHRGGCVEVLGAPRTAGREKVRHVRTHVAAGLLAHVHRELTLFALVKLEAVGIDRHPAFTAVEKIAHSVPAGRAYAALGPAHQPADLEGKFGIAIVEA